MGNSSAKTLDDVECLSLEQFNNKNTTPRKMTIHLLSSSKKNCIDLIESLTLTKVPENAYELLEKNIETKLTLFSFMNYKMYDSANDIMKAIKDKSIRLIKNPKSEEEVYSEVVVVLDNEDINKQIEIINEEINDKPIQINGEDTILSANPYYVPFLIFLSFNHLDLSKFIPSKTFQYKISLKDILNFQIDLDKFKDKKQEKDKKKEGLKLIEENLDKKENIKLIEKKNNTNLESIDPIEEIKTNMENENDELLKEEKDKKFENIEQINEINEENRRIEKEYLEFERKLKSLFSYYNELGDIFSYKNSLKEEELVTIEDGGNFPVYINILLLGKSGSGKSTLINLLLDEKKSIEGGNGCSTTSKNIIIFKKRNKPLRLYDVKGIENQETIENYFKILEKFNGKNAKSIDRINAIFYCIQYTKGTIVENMVNIVFRKLIEYDIPIIFIITHCEIDFNKKNNNKIIQIKRNSIKTTIENAIKDQLRLEF
jgi:GTP-binding protein EngB required for normal cell division